MPWLWLIAGPNGSGKSTLANGLRKRRLPELVGEPSHTVWINPDDIYREMAAVSAAPPNESDDAVALAAAKAADTAVLAGIEAGVSVIRETVLSTDRFKPIIELAMGRGFNLGLIFVALSSPEACVERVRLRTTLGGHSVPPDRTRARWGRSIANLTWFAERVGIVLVYDNSALGAPVLLYEKQGGTWTAHGTGRIPEIDAAVAPLIQAGRIASRGSAPGL